MLIPPELFVYSFSDVNKLKHTIVEHNSVQRVEGQPDVKKHNDWWTAIRMTVFQHLVGGENVINTYTT